MKKKLKMKFIKRMNNFFLDTPQFQKVIKGVEKILTKEPHLAEPKYRRVLIWRYWTMIDCLRPPFRQSDWLDPQKMMYPDTITRVVRLLNQKK